MDLQTIRDTPPWDWPPDAAETFASTLRNRRAAAEDRLIAAELAGDPVVVDDHMVQLLLTVLQSPDEAEDLRTRAAISLGPALELAWTEEVDDENFSDSPISGEISRSAQHVLQRVYGDETAPKLLRRRALEASVRGPVEWHSDAIRTAYHGTDADWKLTAVFAMRYVSGFEAEILESLKSADADVHFEAVLAAGNWELKRAWPHVSALLKSHKTERSLLLAAIEATPTIAPADELEILSDLSDSDDDEIAEAAQEAMMMAEAIREDKDDSDREDQDESPLNGHGHRRPS